MEISSSEKARLSARLSHLSTARFVIFASLLVVQAIIQYVPNPALHTAAGLWSFIAWAVALTGSDKTSVLLSLTLVIAGAALFTSMDVDPLAAVVSFGENAAILMIMVLVPLIGIVINLGGYAHALAQIAEDAKRPAYLFGVGLLLTYAIGAVLLNAAIALVWTILSPIVDRMGKDPGDFLVPSLPRGYNASLLWTPSSPAMATALVLTGTAWKSIVRPGFLLSLVLLGLAVLVEAGGPALRPSKRRASPRNEPDAQQRSDIPLDRGDARHEKPASIDGNGERKLAWRKTSILAVGLGSFIAAMVALQEMGYTIFQAIVPCIALTLLIWGVLIGKPKETWSECARYFPTKVPKLANQFLLMTTAGFIGTALRVALKDGIPGITGTFEPSVLVITLTASLMVWLISIAGIHSLVGMAIVHSVVAPFALGVSPAHLSLTLLMGAALGFNISPVSATILVTSSCAGRNSVEVGIKRQWKFVIASWLVCSVILSLIRV